MPMSLKFSQSCIKLIFLSNVYFQKDFKPQHQSIVIKKGHIYICVSRFVWVFFVVVFLPFCLLKVTRRSPQEDLFPEIIKALSPICSPGVTSCAAFSTVPYTWLVKSEWILRLMGTVYHWLNITFAFIWIKKRHFVLWNQSPLSTVLQKKPLMSVFMQVSLGVVLNWILVLSLLKWLTFSHQSWLVSIFRKWSLS